MEVDGTTWNMYKRSRASLAGGQGKLTKEGYTGIMRDITLATERNGVEKESR